MTLFFIRAFFLTISSFIGFYLGSTQSHPFLGLGIGCACGMTLILIEISSRRVSVRGLSSMVFGLLLGVFMAKLVADILQLLPWDDYSKSVSRVILTIIFSYLGAVMALRGKDEFNVIIPYVRFKRQDMDERVILLDTSAVIDGRIVDLYKTNFFFARLVAPRFVLKELQTLADSKDQSKRERGRRGIEVLKNMKRDSSMGLRIHEAEDSGEEDVDSRLVRLAKQLDARICTTDYNLSRVAAIQGVEVLNINDLAAALKPVILPGQEVDVRLVKEGKESHQAVAYTDDGTMIVVAEGRPLIGKKVRVSIVSFVPTSAGKIIFAKLVRTK